MMQFPWMSPYVAFDNNPIYFVDPYGLASESGDDSGGCDDSDGTGDNKSKPTGLPESAEDGSTHTADNGKDYIFINDDNGGSWTASTGGDVNINQGQVSTGDAARVSDHVYSILEEGVDAGKDKGDVKNSNFQLYQEYTDFTALIGYKAALYRKLNNENQYDYIFATGGTDDLLDGVTDLKQAIGLLDLQYATSVSDARSIAKWLESTSDFGSLTFTGHSLGGGLAIANALATGYDAITFNPAGINPMTKLYHNLNAQPIIHSYVIEGEVVSVLNSIMFMSPPGNIHTLEAPNSYLGYSSLLNSYV